MVSFNHDIIEQYRPSDLDERDIQSVLSYCAAQECIPDHAAGKLTRFCEHCLLCPPDPDDAPEDDDRHEVWKLAARLLAERFPGS